MIAARALIERETGIRIDLGERLLLSDMAERDAKIRAQNRFHHHLIVASASRAHSGTRSGKPSKGKNSAGSLQGVGVDINPVRIGEAKENARKAGVENLVPFEENDRVRPFRRTPPYPLPIRS